MKKDLDELINEMGDLYKEFKKDVKKATGKDLDEIMDMPINTPEERKAFIDEMTEVNKAINKKTDSCDLEGCFIKIKGGKEFSSLEAKGSSINLIHMLCQGLASVILKAHIDDEDMQDILLKSIVKEVKNAIKNCKFV